MDLLLKKATIIDPQSDFDGKKVDLAIKAGLIQAIEEEISTSQAESVDCEGICVSPGWIDIGVQTGDPGFEHREDLETVAKAAAAGGFTAIASQPNTDPVIHSKSEVLYILNNTRDSVVDFFPLGAVSKNCEGMEITEMFDMFHSGAIAFTDGKKPLQHAGVMMRALQYVKAFDGIVINQPLDSTIAGTGMMHEGFISTSLGLRGIPNLAENLMIQRDIHLAEYTDSRLHIANVSTAEGVEALRMAKAKGLKVTGSVSVMNLVLEDEALKDFDANLKVKPPIRSEEDRQALVQGLIDGTIDFIVTNHVPWDTEGKNLEFAYAKFGAIGLETCFALLNSHLAEELSLQLLVEKLALAPRRTFKLDIPGIQPGQPANLTLFDPTKEWVFREKDIYSKSKNTPFLDRLFRGKVIGVINNNQSLFFNR